MPTRRGPVVVAGLACSLVLLLATTRTWVTADVTDVLIGRRLDVAGSRTAPVVPALAVVGLAASAAVTIAGRVGRVVAGAALLLAGAGAAVAARGVVAGPRTAAGEAIVEATGGTGATAVTGATPWVWVALLAGAGLAACGLLVLAVGRSWRTARRYEIPAPGERGRPSDWDALTEGTDPTSSDRPGEPPGEAICDTMPRRSQGRSHDRSPQEREKEA